MAYVDWTTWTEVDGNNKLTVTANKVDIVNLLDQDIAYVTKDFGAGYFGDFVHKMKLTFTSADVFGVIGAWYMSADEQHSYADFSSNLDGLICLVGSGAGPTYYIQILEADGPSSDGYFIPSVPATYWLELERSGTTFTCKIYSDEFITLVDTLTLTCYTDTLRWMNAPCSYDAALALQFTGSIENLDIGAGVSYAISKVGTVTYGAGVSKVGGVSLANIAKIGTVADE